MISCIPFAGIAWLSHRPTVAQARLTAAFSARLQRLRAADPLS